MKSIFEGYPIVDGTYEDAISYVRVLQYVAAIDGIHNDEKAGIKTLIKSNNGSDKCYDDALAKKISSISDLNLSDEVKKTFAPYLLRDAIGIAYIEGGYSNDEQNQIKLIAEELNISSSALNLIEEAVKHQISATEKWSKSIC